MDRQVGTQKWCWVGHQFTSPDKLYDGTRKAKGEGAAQTTPGGGIPKKIAR